MLTDILLLETVKEGPEQKRTEQHTVGANQKNQTKRPCLSASKEDEEELGNPVQLETMGYSLIQTCAFGFTDILDSGCDITDSGCESIE